MGSTKIKLIATKILRKVVGRVPTDSAGILKVIKYITPSGHCLQRAPVGSDLSSSGTSQIGMFDIQATTKSKYYEHIVLLYLESRRCRYRSIIFACFLPIYYCSYFQWLLGYKQWKMLIMRLKSSNKAIKSSLYV